MTPATTTSSFQRRLPFLPKVISTSCNGYPTTSTTTTTPTISISSHIASGTSLHSSTSHYNNRKRPSCGALLVRKYHHSQCCNFKEMGLIQRGSGTKFASAAVASSHSPTGIISNTGTKSECHIKQHHRRKHHLHLGHASDTSSHPLLNYMEAYLMKQQQQQQQGMENGGNRRDPDERDGVSSSLQNYRVDFFTKSLKMSQKMALLRKMLQMYHKEYQEQNKQEEFKGNISQTTTSSGILFPLPTRISFSPSQRMTFASLMQCENSAEIARLIAKLNEMISDESYLRSQQRVTAKDRELLLKVLQKEGLISESDLNNGGSKTSDASVPEGSHSSSIVIPSLSSMQRRRLEKLTSMSRQQLSTALASLKQTPGKITRENKAIIREWLREHPTRLPNSQERDELQKTTGLSRDQLSQQLHYMRKPRVRISEASKKILREWWNRRLAEAQKSGQNAEEVVSPSSQERKLLMQQTGLTYNQLHGQLKLLKDPASPITREAKSQIFAYLSTNVPEHTAPTFEDREHLVNVTGLSRAQIDHQIFVYRNGGSDLSEGKRSHYIPRESKFIIRKFLEDIGGTVPTSEQRTSLEQRTGLTRLQINNQIRYLRSKMKKEQADSRFT